MDRAIIFDVDGTLAETEETHRRAFNHAFREAGLSWCWDQDVYRELLAVTGGKERIRHFIEDSRNGLLSASAAGIATIVTPGIYTRDETFDEAVLVIDDLEALDIAALENFFDDRLARAHE